MRIDGIECGLYHYNSKDHSLELISILSREQSADLAHEFTVGQSYTKNAAALFIMTARFYRSFWKYRRHDQVYRALYMDAAHLSQTFYLVCTQLGLGPFVTAAINSINIERKLDIDGYEEGAIAICGCGHMSSMDYGLEPNFLPYIPRVEEIQEE